ARVEGLDICGKTGTAQNSQGANHSTFMCFAPRNNPRIAVAVYVEHGGYGASVAVPIASLIVEQYLTDTVKRADLLQRITEIQVNYPMYRPKVETTVLPTTR
ncbi:MAG: penicillin-binding transpeptidase domain-containing protein, partial [Mucinivorans sp.]